MTGVKRKYETKSEYQDLLNLTFGFKLYIINLIDSSLLHVLVLRKSNFRNYRLGNSYPGCFELF